MSRARDVASRDIVDSAVTSAKIANGAITNDDVNASAAIAASKLSGVVAASLVDAKGDLLVGTAADTVGRLGVGSNGHVLTADSAEASGLKWAAAGGGGLVFIASQSFTSVSSVNINDVFSSNYRNYRIIVEGTHSATTIQLRMRLRVSGSDATGADYRDQYVDGNGTTVSSNRNLTTSNQFGTLFANNVSFIAGDVFRPYETVATGFTSVAAGTVTSNPTITMFAGGHSLATSYTGFTFLVDSGTFTGQVRIYGYANS